MNRQIVIELDEKDYQLACRYPDALIAVYAHAIKDGILLDFHGRIIDESKITRCEWLPKQEYMDCNAPTILEATKPS